MASADGGWAVSGSASASCGYGYGGYEVWESTTHQYTPCFAQNLSGGNIAFQATMKMTSDTNDGGGLIFRQIYRFHVSDGEYDLVTPDATQTVGTSNSVHVNSTQSIVLTVIAQGDNIYLYADGTMLAHILDNSSSSGALGLLAYDATNPSIAIFTDVKIWLL
jgi:hypothetical protein